MRRAWVVLSAVFLGVTGWAEASPGGSPGLFSAGVEFGAPYKLGGSVRCDLFLTDGFDSALVLQPIGSVGLGGAKAGLGLGTFRGAGILTARAAFVRTFARPLALEPDRSFVGGELEWSVLHLVSVQAGVLVPFGGGGPAFTWAVGIGVPLVAPDDLLPCPGCH
jgi:hypothetical protein